MTSADREPRLSLASLTSFLLPPHPFQHRIPPDLSGNMNDDSGVEFVSARSRKRPHHHISDSVHSHGQSSRRESVEMTGSSERPNFQSSSRSNPHLTLPRLPPTRFHGDGFDFRRPSGSRPTPRRAEEGRREEVIDLTNEPDSPPTLRVRQPNQSRRGRHPRPPRSERNTMSNVVDLEEETESSPEVEFVRSTIRPVPHQSPSFFDRDDLLRMLQFRARRLPQRPPQNVETLWIDGPRSELDLAVDLAIDIENTSSNSNSEPRESSYKPPSPVPEGFTRNARNDDVVICPNCNEELGGGDEIKQQIWVSKQCGHVYCGECALNRSLTKAKKAIHSSQFRIKPFSKCQIPDCGKPVSSPKSMFQIYM